MPSLSSVESSELDGALVVLRYGFVRSAGVIYGNNCCGDVVARWHGVQHLVDVAVTAHIVDPAVVVSAVDGDLSAFSEGRMRL